jgi:hypothetical protein
MKTARIMALFPSGILPYEVEEEVVSRAYEAMVSALRVDLGLSETQYVQKQARDTQHGP